MGNEPDSNPLSDVMDDKVDDKEFGSDFDAEIDADEKQDPENYIQKLAGKLATSLRKYREDKDELNPELSKFVANSIISAAVPGLGDDDVKVIMDKVKEKSTEEDPNVDGNTEPKLEDSLNTGDEGLKLESKKRKVLFNKEKIGIVKEDIDIDSIIDEIQTPLTEIETPIETKVSKFSRPRFK